MLKGGVWRPVSEKYSNCTLMISSRQATLHLRLLRLLGRQKYTLGFLRTIHGRQYVSYRLRRP
jgi:hypothetical protein